MPQEALPDFDRANQGKHSYTLTFNGATVEVLLQKQAYFIKKCASDAPGPTGQVTWSKCGGPRAAWKTVKERSGFKRFADK